MTVKKTKTRSDTNLAVQSQKTATGLKFQTEKEEGSYYLCGKNKGADQLHGASWKSSLFC